MRTFQGRPRVFFKRFLHACPIGLHFLNDDKTSRKQRRPGSSGHNKSDVLVEHFHQRQRWQEANGGANCGRRQGKSGRRNCFWGMSSTFFFGKFKDRSLVLGHNLAKTDVYPKLMLFSSKSSIEWYQRWPASDIPILSYPGLNSLNPDFGFKQG